MKFLTLLAALLIVAMLGAVTAAQERILVGVNMELTGYSADFGIEQNRGIAAAHRLQPSVTVNGVTYDIELLICDNQTQREESANCAARLIGQGAVGVLGGFSSSMSIAAAPIFQDAGVTQISTGSTNPVLTELGNHIFRIPFTDNYQGQAIASYAYDVLGARRAVIFRQSDDDFSVGITRILVDAFNALGAQVQVQSFNQTTVDFSAQLNNARRFNPDVLISTAFCQLTGPLVRQSRSVGFAQPWLGGDSLDAPSCAELGGQAFQGVQFTGFPDLDQLEPEAVERAQAVRAAYFELYPNSTGFGGVTLAGSDAYGVLRAAIEDALQAGASPSNAAQFRSAVRNALAEMTDYPGVTGVLTYAGTDGTPASRSIGLLEVENVQANGSYDRVPKGFFVIHPDGTEFHPGA